MHQMVRGTRFYAKDDRLRMGETKPNHHLTHRRKLRYHELPQSLLLPKNIVSRILNTLVVSN